MAALVVAALFWGNCFSCPQLLLALRSNQPAHGCCHRTKQVPQECRTQVFRHFVKTDPVTPAPALPVVALVTEPAAFIAVLADQFPSLVEHAPPGDLFSLRV